MLCNHTLCHAYPVNQQCVDKQKVWLCYLTIHKAWTAINHHFNVSVDSLPQCQKEAAKHLTYSISQAIDDGKCKADMDTSLGYKSYLSVWVCYNLELNSWLK